MSSPSGGSALHGFRVLANAAVKPVRAPSDDKRIACVGANDVAVVLKIAHVDSLCIADREIHFVGQAVPELFGEPRRAFGGIRRRYGYLRGKYFSAARSPEQDASTDDTVSTLSASASIFFINLFSFGGIFFSRICAILLP